jgi:hypothetical protein
VKVKSVSRVSVGTLVLVVIGSHMEGREGSDVKGLLMRLAAAPVPTGLHTGLEGLAGRRVAGSAAGVETGVMVSA